LGIIFNMCVCVCVWLQTWLILKLFYEQFWQNVYYIWLQIMPILIITLILIIIIVTTHYLFYSLRVINYSYMSTEYNIVLYELHTTYIIWVGVNRIMLVEFGNLRCVENLNIIFSVINYIDTYYIYIIFFTYKMKYP